MPDIDLESRREIYTSIDANPGIHFSDLLDRLDYAQGTLQYYVRQLEDEGLVEVSDDGKFTRYYAAGEFASDEQAIMNAFRRKYSRRIIAHLVVDEALTTSQLSDRLGKSPSTVSWHLSKLVDAGVAERNRDGQRVFYRLTDPGRATYLYTVYQGSFTDTVVDRLLGLWNQF